jgi:hypothetical protein
LIERLAALKATLSVCAPVEPAIKSLFQEQQLHDVEEQEESAEVQSATNAVARAAVETDALETDTPGGSMHHAASHEVVHDFPPQPERPVQQHEVHLSEEGADISDSHPAAAAGEDEYDDVPILDDLKLEGGADAPQLEALTAALCKHALQKIAVRNRPVTQNSVRSDLRINLRKPTQANALRRDGPHSSSELRKNAL